MSLNGDMTLTTLNTTNQGYNLVMNPVNDSGVDVTITDAVNLRVGGDVTIGDSTVDIFLFTGGLDTTAVTGTVTRADGIPALHSTNNLEIGLLYHVIGADFVEEFAVSSHLLDHLRVRAWERASAMGSPPTRIRPQGVL